MYIFLDTEFTDFKDSDLISLGLVTEDGTKEFYVEIADFNEMMSSDWVRKIVYPLLQKGKYAMRRADAAKALDDFISTIQDPVIVVDYYTDWHLFMGLITEANPTPKLQGLNTADALKECVAARYSQANDHMLERAYRTMMVTEDICYRIRHHALMDARAMLQGWQEALKLFD